MIEFAVVGTWAFKIAVGVLIPSVLWVVFKIHNLELQMKDRITRKDAAEMVSRAIDGIDGKIDLILNHMLERNNG